MKSLCASALLLAGGLCVAAPVAAQPMPAPDQPDMTASQPVGQAGPGIPGPQAVNPAPGATGPYVGAGRQGFYDVDTRLQQMDGAVSSLPAGQRRRAMAEIHQIKGFEATQRARHGGELRDWDREAMSQKLDALAQHYPALGGGQPPA